MNGYLQQLRKLFSKKASKQICFLALVSSLALHGLSADETQCDYLRRQVIENSALISPLAKSQYMERFGRQCMGNAQFEARLIDLYIQAGRFERAHQMLAEALREHPSAPELLASQARLRRWREAPSATPLPASGESKKAWDVALVIPRTGL